MDEEDFLDKERLELQRKIIGCAAREAYWECVRARVQLCSYPELIEGYYAGLNPHPEDHPAWITEWEDYA